MAELDLKQIEDKLNEEFKGDSRRLVFWYDEKREFIDDIESLDLINAKKHYLTGDNSFETKLLLERKDKKNNYLIYAPFEKPESRENHLADTIKYSKEFYADRASLIALDLGLDEKGKRIIERHMTFFNAKDRTKRFYDLEGLTSDEATIEIGLLSATLKLKVINFEEVVRMVMTRGDLKNNTHLSEFKKYGLEHVFWKHIGHIFSYIDEDASLEKFLISLFITYVNFSVKGNLPASLDKHLLNKSGTIIAFMDQIMNNILYMEEFDNLSHRIFISIKGENLFNNLSVESIIDLDLFKFADEKIIDWIIERLLDENLNSSIDNMKIPGICEHREKLHFGKSFRAEYHLLKYAYHVISKVNYDPASDIISMVDRYDKEDYKIDTYYRKFNYYLDNTGNQHKFDKLQELVESIYTNKFLNKLTKEFNDKFSFDELQGRFKFQRNFYKNYVEITKESLVVIVSDGFRYELAKELVEKMNRDKKYETVEIEPQIGIIPTYTRLGMASLLPHKELTINDNYDVLVDGKACTNLLQRDRILKDTNPSAAAINYDDIKKYKRDELREFFIGKSLVYIYHDQIDSRGESSEDEVFTACKEAIDELMDLMVRLTDSTSRTRFIITSDHGFIYKRNKLIEADKIDSFFSKEDQLNKRFIISDENYDVVGTRNFMVADILGTYDKRAVTVPLTSNIFKLAGGGQNYIHGGTSPQEVLIPLVQVKTIRGFKEEKNVAISLISMLSKVTGLIINLDFIQQEPISDVIIPTDYKIAFANDKGEIISNEVNHSADSKEKESANRIFRLQFTLKNQKYNRHDKYYLIALDTKTGMEIFRHEVIIDIAFSDDFGFDL